MCPKHIWSKEEVVSALQTHLNNSAYTDLPANDERRGLSVIYSELVVSNPTRSGKLDCMAQLLRALECIDEQEADCNLRGSVYYRHDSSWFWYENCSFGGIRVYVEDPSLSRKVVCPFGHWMPFLAGQGAFKMYPTYYATRYMRNHWRIFSKQNYLMLQGRQHLYWTKVYRAMANHDPNLGVLVNAAIGVAV